MARRGDHIARRAAVFAVAVAERQGGDTTEAQQEKQDRDDPDHDLDTQVRIAALGRTVWTPHSRVRIHHIR
jgi:hypothetical protein